MRGLSLFNVVFLVGLLSSVRIMVAGVERNLGDAGAVVRTRWAMLAGAMTLSGFLGSLLTRLNVSASVTAFAAIGAVMIGAGSARLLVRQAVAMPVSDHEFDPRYELQGVPALVVEEIPACGQGIVLVPTRAGPPALMAARSLDGQAIPRDVEVGVERVDAGVAFVEVWSAIEARI